MPLHAKLCVTTAAAYNRERVRAAGVFMVNVAGGLGSGKTTLVRAALSRLTGRRRTGVIAATPPAESGHTSGEAYAQADVVLRVPTGSEPWLTAAQVGASLEILPLEELDILLIENLGSRGDGSGAPDLGQDATVCVLSVIAADGAAADDCDCGEAPVLVVFNKIDLLPMMGLRPPTSGHEGVGESGAIELSARTGAGVQEFVDWLLARSAAL